VYYERDVRWMVALLCSAIEWGEWKCWVTNLEWLGNWLVMELWKQPCRALNERH
jgi:hypothetical protein